jgi:hypothetical protein
MFHNYLIKKLSSIKKGVLGFWGFGVLFEVNSDIELGGIMRIFNKLAQFQHPLKIVYQGSHPILDKLLKRFESTLDNRKLEINQKADEFFGV